MVSHPGSYVKQPMEEEPTNSCGIKTPQDTESCCHIGRYI